MVGLGEAVVVVLFAGLVVVVEFETVVLPLLVVVVVVLLTVALPLVAIGVLAGVATVMVLLATTELFAGLLVVLFAGASPQAMPRAPRPKTVESAITFFISIRLLSFSKDIYLFLKYPG